MRKPYHVILGASCGILTGFDPFLAMLGSIAPDKDILIEKLFGLRRKRLLTSHRGFTHHLLLIPAFSITTVLISESLWGYWVASFLVGYVVHLLADMLTPLGLPYKFSYYPRVSLKLFKTGSVEESVFMLFVVLLTGITIVLNPQLLLKPLLFYLQKLNSSLTLTEHLTLLLSSGL